MSTKQNFQQGFLPEENIFSNENLTPERRRRSSRRSWFEKTPGMLGKGITYDIAVETNAESKVKLKRKSDAETETLLLTHFTSPPKIDFGKAKGNVLKTRNLLVKNPHEYSQTVSVERFPYKKHFNIDLISFTVDAESSILLTLTWQPEEEGYCREMILFLVDGAYRLQAFVMGSMEKPQKKNVHRKGIMGHSVKKPFAVIQTSSLASINKSYSPKKKTSRRSIGKSRKAVSQQSNKPQTEEPVVSTNKCTIQIACKVDANVEPKHDRTIENMSPILSFKEKKVPVYGFEQAGVLNSPIICQAQGSAFKNNMDLGEAFIQSTPFIDKGQQAFTFNTERKSSSHTEENEPEQSIGPKKDFLSPTSFLHDSLTSCVTGDSDKIPLHEKDLQENANDLLSPEPQKSTLSDVKDFLSPEAFLQQLNNSKVTQEAGGECKDGIRIPSPQAVLSAPIPHEVLVKQLDSVKSSLKEGILPCMPTQCPAVALPAAETSKHQKISTPVFADRRETFVKGDVNSPSLDPPSISSPRRTTFTVKSRLSKNIGKGTPSYPQYLGPNKISILHEKMKELDASLNMSVDSLDGCESQISQAPAGKRLQNQSKCSSGTFVFDNNYSLINTPEREGIGFNNGKNFEENHDQKRMEESWIPTPERHLNNFVMEKHAKQKMKDSVFSKGCKVNRSTQNKNDTFYNDYLNTPEKMAGKMLGSNHTNGVTIADLSPLCEQSTEESKHCHCGSKKGMSTFSLSDDDSILVAMTTDMSPASRDALKHSFHIDSNMLPESPELDMSRRSTQVIANPINLHTSKEECIANTNSDEDNDEDEFEDTVEHIEDLEKLEEEDDVYLSCEEEEKENRKEVCSQSMMQEKGQNYDYDENRQDSDNSEPGDDDENKENVSPPIALIESESTRVKHKNIDKSLVHHVLAELPIDEAEYFANSQDAIRHPRTDKLTPKKKQLVEKEKLQANVKTGISCEAFVQSSVSEQFVQNGVNEKILELSVDLQCSAAIPNISSDDTEIMTSPGLQAVSSKMHRILSDTVVISGNTDKLEDDMYGIETQKRLSCTINEASLSSPKPLKDIHVADTPTCLPQPSSMFISISPPTQTAEDFPIHRSKVIAPFLKKRPLATSKENIVQKKRKSNEGKIIHETRTSAKNEKTSASSINKTAEGVPLTAKERRAKTKGYKPSQLKTNTNIKAVSQNLPKKDNDVPKPRVASVKGLAQSKLLLVKKTKTALPKLPMAYASKNMYYDERWMQKQERGFVNWINFVLTPAEDYHSSNKKVKVDAGALCIDLPRNKVQKAPTKEVLSMRDYAARRRLNQLRRQACHLFQSADVVHVIQKLEAEIENLRLVIRKDRMVHADLGLKQGILDMLLSYNPLWLRIGLETVYGEMILIDNNNDVIGLSRFVVTRLLANPDIAMEYAHPSVPHLYRDGYADAIARHLLKKFLMLVYFLDQGKSKRLINHDPCLFCNDSEFKSSKAVLIHFSKNYLSGEGDVTKHLGYLGYLVSHVQTPMDEFDYAVSTLATDLRDGIRLARVIETLKQKRTLSGNMRAPAISRLQKIHNMDVVFKALADDGLHFENSDKKVTSRDVVDGHREKTLHLLWSLILHYQVQVLINEEQLKNEIKMLEKSLDVRNQLQALRRYEEVLERKKRESEVPDIDMQNKTLQLLLKWARVVCAFYGIKIENFTVSFGDGRGLCALVHHYHPALLPLTFVHMETTLTYFDELEAKQTRNQHLDLDSSDAFSPTPFPVADDPARYEILLNNERANFKLLYEKVSDLGGVPLMLRSIDMSNTIPDEKVVVTYISYLCSRLLDVRHESRAARVIQLAWRRYYLRKSKGALEGKKKAALKIQKAFRAFLTRQRFSKQTAAAVSIQKSFRGYQAKKLLLTLKEEKRQKQISHFVVILQAHVRCFLVKRQIVQQQKAATVIQKYFKGFLTRKHYRTTVKAVLFLQGMLRSWQEMKKLQKQYEQMKLSAVVIQTAVRYWLESQKHKKFKATITIQKMWRGYNQRKQLALENSAATKIQSFFRAHLQRTWFNTYRSAATCIQQRFRAYQAMLEPRKQYLEVKCATVVIQKYFRGSRARLMHRKSCMAAVKIQAWFRMHRQQVAYRNIKTATIIVQRYFRLVKLTRETQWKFDRLRSACICIQSFWKMVRTRKIYKAVLQEVKENQAAVKIQSLYKRLRQRCQFLRWKTAAIQIQATWRMKQMKRRYLTLQKAAIVVQTQFRATKLMQSCRRDFLSQRNAAIIIQSLYRGNKIRIMMRKLDKSAIIIQSAFRGFCAKKNFQMQKQTTIVIQHWFRRCFLAKRVQKDFVQKKRAVIYLQSVFRGHLVRTSLKRQNSAAVLIQSHFRMYCAKKSYIQKLRSVLLIQKWYKNAAVSKKMRQRYLHLKSAAVRLQATYKGHLCRRHLATKHKSAVIIQTAFRRHMCERDYRAKLLATIKIQSWYRTIKETQCIRAYFLNKILCVMTIQRCMRGWLARHQLQKKQSATICIQKAIKGFLVRRKYRVVLKSTVYLQRWYRNILLGRKNREKFLEARSATVKLQSVYRGFRTRQNLNHQHKAATVLQSSFRKYKAEKGFMQKRLATIKIQQWFRNILLGQKIRTNFLIKVGAAICIQSAVRGYLVRTAAKRRSQAAIVLQSAFRQHCMTKKFQKQREAAILIQKWFRNCLLTRHAKEDYMNKKRATLTIQKHLRGFQARKIFRKDLKDVIHCQAIVKGFFQRQFYQKLRWAVSVFQERYRAKMKGQKAKSEYCALKEAVIKIQSFFRSLRIFSEYKKMKRSAISIQACFRMHCQRNHYNSQKSAALCIQRKWRACLLRNKCRKEYLTQIGAVITIQSVVKMFLARKRYSETINKIKEVQACVKRFLCQKKYHHTRELVIKLQSRMRECLLMKKERREYLHLRKTVIIIQSYVRMHHAKVLLKRIHSAIVIQKFVRMLLLKQTFLKQKKAAILLQSYWRGYLVRNKITKMTKAARVIQTNLRIYLLKKRFREYVVIRRDAVSKIQRIIRRFLLKCRKQKHQSATRIQSQVRMWSCRKAYLRRCQQYVLLQALLRGFLARKNVQHLKKQNSAAICIQRAYKQFSLKKAEEERKQKRAEYLRNFGITVQYYLKAIAIQRCYRRFKVLQKAKERLNKIVLIQRWMRAKLERKRYLKLLDIQQQKHRAALKLQAVIRMWLKRRQTQKQVQAAVVFQCVWRGRKVRVSIGSKKIEQVRRSLKEATAAATEEKKLGNRMTCALDYLLKYKQLLQVYEALVHLETSTRLSPHCCERIVEARALCVLYQLIKKCNRSQPHMEIISYCVSILLNVAKYEKTREATFEVEGAVEVILELMQIYREKGLIFTRCCTLLALLGMVDFQRKACVADPKFISKLQSIQYLTAKKHKITESRMLQKARMTAAKSFNSTLPLAMAHKKKPKIQPDWVLQRNKMEAIENPVVAINFVLENFNIQPKS